ncbi:MULTISPECIES: glycosyltransferase family 2 protein [Calothrix]|uniref:Glycosyltransferase family 2 protein n=2 Tax=Calothrix TaxID=1186 RepID=A0ABR8ALF0_9CYAN|nr:MULTISPECIES: glycosyltransferase family 2 protein [Calothrix]MBD2200065.1 glycosyltransferase family 2 protein [Calothrix parietina FACHB-288]MBD2229041.1 glycosyltransferase family 2 protein [Calothrix anomala FACHB-343]
MSGHAKVSVIVPVYQVEKYIHETISSILQQTWQDFELLIIDDESRDRSIEICREFTDSRIKIISQKNRGLAGARNTGIRHAQGEYLAFLDSDDLWLPQKLEKHLHHLENNPTIGISFSRSAFIDEQGKPLGIYQMPKLKNISASDLFCRNPIGNGSAVVIRREVLQEIKFAETVDGVLEDWYFDESFRQSEDIECWLRIILQTKWQIEGIPEALTLYRVNSGGLSANLLKQLESWERIIDKAKVYAPEFIAKWENPARAYQLRYLARRAVRQRDSKVAVELVNRALMTHWQILLAEPHRTILTILAAYLQHLLPKSFYSQIEALSLQITGANQKRQINQDQFV